MNKNQKRSAAQSKRQQQKRFRRELIRIGEYMISGGLYFWSGYAVFFVAFSLLGINLFWSKLLSNIVGWTVNYFALRFWVFASSNSKGHQVEVTGRYAFITLVNFGLDYLIVYGLQRLGLTPYLGQFVSSAFFTVWNYIWYKTFVFASHIHHRPRKSKTTKKR